MTYTYERQAGSMDKIPEVIPAKCGKCKYFTSTGSFDLYKGHCSFYEEPTFSNYQCKAKREEKHEIEQSPEALANLYSVKKCPSCNAISGESAKYCNSCGVVLNDKYIESPVCPICGQSYSSGTKFCEADGNPLVSEDSMVPRCTKCGKEYSKEAKFCSEDGGKILPTFLHSSEISTITDADPVGHSSYKKAPIWDRIVASTFDLLIALVYAIPAMIMYQYWLSPDGEDIHLVLYFIFLVLPIVYMWTKDGMKGGQSYGKKARGLMVVYLETNQPCSKSRSGGRALTTYLLSLTPFIFISEVVEFVFFAVILSFIEPIMVLARRDGRRIADLVTNVQVIRKEDYISRTVVE